MGLPNWRGKWPKTRSVKDWIVASGEKALAIKDVSDRLLTLSFAIERLAERGFQKAAQPLFAKFQADVAAHPKAIDITLVAETYISMGKRDTARKFFEAAIAEVSANKKLQRARRMNILASLRRNALYLQLTELFPDLTDVERCKVEYEIALDKADVALKNGEQEAARKLARIAENAIRRVPPHRALRLWPEHLLTLYAKIGDRPSALRMLRRIAKNDRSVQIIGKTLVNLGLRDLAIDMARRQVATALDEARAMSLPNYHFPAMNIAAAIEFLADHDEVELARKELNAVMKEVDSWATHRSAWVEAAVHSALATAGAKLSDRAAIETMLNRARQAGHSERSTFRPMAWQSIIDAYAAIGAWDEALALAKKHGAKEDLRRRQAVLLAKAGRMNEIATVMKESTTPLEAANVCWWVAVTLDGL